MTPDESWGFFIFMIMDAPWKKFLHEVLEDDYNKLIELYYLLRKMFQRHDIENWQLERGEGLTREMYMMRDYITNSLSKITGDLKSYGFLTPENQPEFIDYIQNKLRIIDSETPLKN